MCLDQKFPEVDRGTASRHVGVGKGGVYWLHILVSAGDGTIRLREGSDASGEILISIKKDAGQPGMTRFDPPLPYEKGLYVDLVDHIQDWTIAFDRMEG